MSLPPTTRLAHPLCNRPPSSQQPSPKAGDVSLLRGNQATQERGKQPHPIPQERPHTPTTHLAHPHCNRPPSSQQPSPKAGDASLLRGNQPTHKLGSQPHPLLQQQPHTPTTRHISLPGVTLRFPLRHRLNPVQVSPPTRTSTQPVGDLGRTPHLGNAPAIGP